MERLNHLQNLSSSSLYMNIEYQSLIKLSGCFRVYQTKSNEFPINRRSTTNGIKNFMYKLHFTGKEE